MVVCRAFNLLQQEADVKLENILNRIGDCLIDGSSNEEDEEEEEGRSGIK